MTGCRDKRPDHGGPGRFSRNQFIFYALLMLLIIGAAGLNLYWRDTHRQIMAVTAHESHLAGLDQIMLFERAPLDLIKNMFMFHSGSGAYLTLYNLSASVPVMIFGLGYDQMMLNSLFYYILTILFVFGAAKRISGPHGALAAAMVVALTPEVFLWSSIYNSRIAVIAAAACALYLLFASDKLTKTWPSLLLLLLNYSSFFLSETVGEKLQIPLLTAVGIGYFLVEQLIVRKSGWTKSVMWTGVFAVAGVAILFSALFGSGLFHKIYSYVVRESVTLSSGPYASGSSFSNPISLLTYPVLFYHMALFPMFSIMCLASVFFLGIHWRKAEAPVLVLLSAPFMVLSFINKKDPAFLLFLLPVIAVVIGAAVARFRRGAEYFLLAALIFFGGSWVLYNLVFLTVKGDIAKVKHELVLKKFTYLFKGSHFIHWVPVSTKYLPRDLAEEIGESAKQKGRLQALLLIDNTRDDAELFRYFLRIQAHEHHIDILDPFVRTQHVQSKFSFENQNFARLNPDYIVDFLVPSNTSADWKQTSDERFEIYLESIKSYPYYSYRSGSFREYASLLAELPWEKYKRRDDVYKVAFFKKTAVIYTRRSGDESEVKNW